MTLRYLSLFSGIGGMDLGFDRAGMVCAGQVEIDNYCRRVLAKHWPDVPRMADINEVNGDEFGAVDVICGGFPCQDVSVAGRRAGLAGERSGLWYEFHRIIDRVKPGIVVIENVPGLLSSNGGRDFAAVLCGLVECGYGVAWRVLDAQYFGVPQRRRRVFIVGSLGDGRAAEILFEREGGGGDSPKGRQAGAELAYSLRADASRSGDKGDGGINTTMIPVCATLNSGGNNGGFRTEPGEHLVAIPLRAEGHDASEDGTGRQNYATCPNGVRRLTPVECERLQGFPDGHTEGQSDSARYRQLGNAVAVPVAEWLGRHIVAAEMETNQ